MTMWNQMTIGKKLGFSLGALMTLTLGLGFAAWHAVSSLSAELDTAVSKTAVKLDLANALGKRLNEIAAANRGVMLAYMNKDERFVEENSRRLTAARKRAGEQLREIQRLLISPESI